MKAVVTLMIMMFAGQVAKADVIATRNPLLDPLTRIFTACDECSKMEATRKIFTDAHADQSQKNLRKAGAAVVTATDHGSRLSNIAQNDRVALRGPHYANEIKAFMYLAIDALPYAQDDQIDATIAYLNSELGSRRLFEEVLNDEIVNKPENFCRKDFLVKRVANAECELANGIETDLAAASKRAPKLTVCKPMIEKIQNCYARQARASQQKSLERMK